MLSRTERGPVVDISVAPCWTVNIVTVSSGHIVVAVSQHGESDTGFPAYTVPFMGFSSNNTAWEITIGARPRMANTVYMIIPFETGMYADEIEG